MSKNEDPGHFLSFRNSVNILSCKLYVCFCPIDEEIWVNMRSKWRILLRVLCSARYSAQKLKLDSENRNSESNLGSCTVAYTTKDPESYSAIYSSHLLKFLYNSQQNNTARDFTAILSLLWSRAEQV